MLDNLQRNSGLRRLIDLGDRQLCQSKVSDPQTMAEDKRRPTVWYKQRLFAFYFVGERAQIERLVREAPGELLPNILGVLVKALDLSQQLRVHIHPAFIPAIRMPAVSRQNALEWAQVVKNKLTTGRVETISVVGPPGPSYTIRREE